MKPHRLLRFHLVARIALLWQATAVCVAAWFAPTSLVHTAMVQGGQPALSVLWLLSGIVGVGWVDVFINDTLPDRFTMTWAKGRRHLGYAALAGTYLVLAFAFAAHTGSPGSPVLISTFATNAAVCAWFSWTAALRPDHAL